MPLTPEELAAHLEQMGPDETLNILGCRVQRYHGGGDCFALHDENRPAGLKHPGGLRCPGTALETARGVLDEDAKRRRKARYAAAHAARWRQMQQQQQRQAQGG
jgi:hypothetical protein